MANEMDDPGLLWDAIVHGDAAKLAELLRASGSQTPVSTVGAEGQTPLHLACDINGDGTECIKLLCEHGASVHAEDAVQRTPLLVACEVKSLGAARFLIENTSASLQASDENNMTPLHWLAAHGAAELLAQCVAKGANVDATNSSLQTPLHLALMRGELACCFVLLDACASPTALDEERRNAMHLAMQHSGGLGACSESTLLLLRLLQIAPGLVQQADADKRTPLHWAAGKNALPCVKALISSAAEVDACDWAQRTPLHWAADRAAEGCTKLLLSHLPAADGTTSPSGTPVDAVDWGGYTALHYAARRGAIGCVKALLGHGANRRMVSMNGELPADLTTCSVTKVLLEERIGMKRQRSLSSANSLVLFSLLPDLAKQFYEAWTKGGDVQSFLADDLKAMAAPPSPSGKLLHETMKSASDIAIDSMHVCTQTSKVVVELHTAAGSKAMHSLTFTDDGLISSFVPYACVVA